MAADVVFITGGRELRLVLEVKERNNAAIDGSCRGMFLTEVGGRYKDRQQAQQDAHNLGIEATTDTEILKHIQDIIISI